MQTLKEMSEIVGVSGYEEYIVRYVKDCLENHNCENVSIDRIGNLFVHKKGVDTSPHLMIIAHIDEVGFQVMSLKEDGSAKIKALGNIKTWNTINQKIITNDGRKKGIATCDNPQDIKPHEFDKITVMPTTGSFDIGDVFGFDIELIETDRQYIGKALDNRASCYLMYKAICDFSICNNDVDFVFSVQEEVGMRGARVAVSEVAPDIIIDLDVSPIGERNSLKLGNGIGIKISDSIGISTTRLVEELEKIACEENIKYQMEVSDCGTSELIITNEKDVGAERIGISIPCHNIHSSLTCINKEDLEMGLRLINAILQRGLTLKQL